MHCGCVSSCVLKELKNGKYFVAFSHERIWPPQLHNPINIQYTEHTCLPLAMAWIPWHHKPRRVLEALAVDLWIALPKIPQHVRLYSSQCPSRWQMTSIDRRRVLSGLCPVCCYIDATRFSRLGSALPEWSSFVFRWGQGYGSSGLDLL